jgi:CRISPR-associated protein Cmr1
LPGLTFVLTVRCPRDRETEVRNAIRAWLLFGGYGGRTRRGSGSLTVVDEPSAGPGGSRSAWLPRAATREAMRELFDGIDIFAPPSHPASVGDTPWLAGATLSLRTTPADGAEKAWLQALDWLRDFRQGAPPRRLDQGKGRTMTQGRADPTPPGAAAGDDGDATYARRSGSDPKRPGISNWPEPDKVRHFSTPSLGPWAHDPGRHNQVAAWPRAGFGLPIIGRFQQKDRNDKFWRASGCCEPDDYQLLWRDPVPPAARANEPTAPRERLASPVIVKALPLSGGRFVPCALWLNRAYPQGEVGLYRKRGGPLELVPGSGAPFGRLVAPGDEVFFLALRDKASLRQAFLDWLRDERKCDQRVAP